MTWENIVSIIVVELLISAYDSTDDITTNLGEGGTEESSGCWGYPSISWEKFVNVEAY